MMTRKQRTAPRGSAEQRTAPVADLETERLAGRLAEMVTTLSECEPALATDAVRAILATGQDLDALEVVAMALIAVESRQRGQLRVPAYLRPGEGRTVSARRADRRARAAEVASAPTEAPAVVVDLRAEPAHVSLDLTGPEPAS